MLKQADTLVRCVEGRYATDAELEFLEKYAQGFRLRVQTYQAIRASEAEIVDQVQSRLQTVAPGLLHYGNSDISQKWRKDTIRVLRYSAIAMLMNDPETLKERFLLWFQTIMRAFGAQPSCNQTYDIMQDVVKQKLTPLQASLVCPILELNRQVLADTSSRTTPGGTPY
jgi:hypothetical protein